MELTNIELTRALLECCDAGWDMVTQVTDRKGHDRRYSLDDSQLRGMGYRCRCRSVLACPTRCAGTGEPPLVGAAEAGPAGCAEPGRAGCPAGLGQRGRSADSTPGVVATGW